MIFLKETHYAYAVAYMKTFENKMLTSNEIESLLNAADLKQAMKILADKGFGNGKTDETASDILKSELEKIWAEAKNACPDDAPLDVVLYKNDFHNLKTILKAIMSDVSFDNLLLKPCIADPYEIEDAVKSQNFENLPHFIKDSAKEAFKMLGETRDGQSMEVFLDRACLEKMRERAEKEESEFLKSWVELNILIANMKTAARATGRSADFIKNAMVESKDSKMLIDASLKSLKDVAETVSKIGYPKGAELLLNSFSDFEKWCDNLKMDYVKKGKAKSFGFEPLLAFLIGKEFELQTVRIILSGKENSVPNEIIRERLRDMYV